MTLEQWKEEFERAQKMLSSGQGARLFTADFASVPNTSRLADWLATKWAPAVLRTYEIATIRAGERPVYVSRVDDDKVEIVWQQLVNFESVTVGRMTIEVKNDGLVALRGPGDKNSGFGSVSNKPLNGEDVIVRFLAEAASQAVEKGLAKKVNTHNEWLQQDLQVFVLQISSSLNRQLLRQSFPRRNLSWLLPSLH